LQALRWQDVDLEGGVICVKRSWDDKEHIVVEPKSRAGLRKVPIPGLLRSELVEHRFRSGRRDGLVLGAGAERPFCPSVISRRANRAWLKASLQPITLHEARHTFASLMIAAGVNAKCLSTYMGHSSVTITYDRYGHLMPGNETDSVARFDSYLAEANRR
jgi:integrase